MTTEYLDRNARQLVLLAFVCFVVLLASAAAVGGCAGFLLSSWMAARREASIELSIGPEYAYAGVDNGKFAQVVLFVPRDTDIEQDVREIVAVRDQLLQRPKPTLLIICSPPLEELLAQSVLPLAEARCQPLFWVRPLAAQ